MTVNQHDKCAHNLCVFCSWVASAQTLCSTSLVDNSGALAQGNVWEGWTRSPVAMTTWSSNEGDRHKTAVATFLTARLSSPTVCVGQARRQARPPSMPRRYLRYALSSPITNRFFQSVQHREPVGLHRGRSLSRRTDLGPVDIACWSDHFSNPLLHCTSQNWTYIVARYVACHT